MKHSNRLILSLLLISFSPCSLFSTLEVTGVGIYQEPGTISDNKIHDEIISSKKIANDNAGIFTYAILNTDDDTDVVQNNFLTFPNPNILEDDESFNKFYKTFYENFLKNESFCSVHIKHYSLPNRVTIWVARDNLTQILTNNFPENPLSVFAEAELKTHKEGGYYYEPLYQSYNPNVPLLSGLRYILLLSPETFSILTTLVAFQNKTSISNDTLESFCQKIIYTSIAQLDSKNIKVDNFQAKKIAGEFITALINQFTTMQKQNDDEIKYAQMSAILLCFNDENVKATQPLPPTTPRTSFTTLSSSKDKAYPKNALKIGGIVGVSLIGLSGVAGILYAFRDKIRHIFYPHSATTVAMVQKNANSTADLKKVIPAPVSTKK